MHELPWGREIDENFGGGEGEEMGIETWGIRILQLGEGWSRREMKGVFLFLFNKNSVNTN